MGTKRKVKRSAEIEDVKLVEVFEDFIAEKEAHGISPATIRCYRQSFNKFIDFIGNDITGNTIKQASIFKWIGTMRQDEISHNSINHYLRDVRTFLYWCMKSDRGYITPSFEIREIRGQEEPPKTYSDDEQEELVKKPRRSDSFVEWRTWAICNWVLGTGNRAATICEVRIGDIDFNKREIVLSHTKSKKAQIIPLSSSLETVIKEYIRMWRKEAPEDTYLFCNNGEEQLTTNALRLSFARYCQKRGVDKSSIHGLRHSFAKGWIMNGGDLIRLQKILGHSTLEMTRHYVDLYTEDLKEGFNAVNPLDTLKKGVARKKRVQRSE